MMPVYLMIAYSNVSLMVPVTLMGIAFSLIPAVMWPSVAYIVNEHRLGTAYALMSLLQQIGFFIFNLAIGKANDYQPCRAAELPRLRAGNVDLLHSRLPGSVLCPAAATARNRTQCAWTGDHNNGDRGGLTRGIFELSVRTVRVRFPTCGKAGSSIADSQEAHP